MKTKLLKKVRKRFTITYYSRQITRWGNIYYGAFMVLDDKDSEYYNKIVEISPVPTIFKHNSILVVPRKEEAKKLLLQELYDWIRDSYKHTRKRIPKQKIEKIWYNPVKNNLK